jgi:hypothetical protein
MALQTVNEVVALVKELNLDPAGDVWNISNPSILRHINAAQDLIDQSFMEYGIETMILWKTWANVPASTQSIGRATTPALPDGFVLPLELWEKFPSEPTQNWAKMGEMQTIPPNLMQTDRLGSWSWNGDAIKFAGCNNICDINARYQGFPADYTTGTDVLAVTGSVRALAYLASSIALRARDAHQIADRYEKVGTDAARALARVQAAGEDGFTVVRRPYRPRISAPYRFTL